MIKVDKSKAIELIQIEDLNKKFKQFILDIDMQQVNKDPTGKYKKMIQQAIKKNTLEIKGQQHKYLPNIKPEHPKLNIHIKTHKQNQPIRPVINNTPAPAYKLAKHMNTKLQQLLNLPNTYNIKHIQDIAEDLRNIRIKETDRIVTLDISDLYINLPINGVLNATKHWLQMNNNEGTTITQILNVTQTILEQNYFQAIFKPTKRHSSRITYIRDNGRSIPAIC